MFCHLFILYLSSMSDCVRALTPGKDPILFNNNMQRCNCRNNEQCDQDGLCPNGRCDKYFIGIHCQHADITMIDTANHNIPQVLLDGDPDTCVDENFIEKIIVNTSPLHYFWIFFTVQEGKPLSPNLVAFKMNTTINHLLFYTFKTGQNSVLIKSKQHVTYTKLELTNLKSICTLHISIGRNLALSGRTRQSSDLATSTTSHEANDGYEGTALTNEIGRSCAMTTGRDGNKMWWEINLMHDSLMNLIIIINHMYKKCPHVEFRAFGGTVLKRKEIFSSKFQELISKQFILIPHDDIMNTIRLELTTNEEISGDQDYCLRKSFSLCEVQVFGEHNCPNDKSGALCEIPCPGCTSDGCDPDWSCLNGCSQGWSGPWCSHNNLKVDRCNGFTYGPNCEYECEDNCANEGLCNEDTGHCRDGCKPGFFPPNCQQRCPEGRYGMNCSQACIHCLKNITSGNFSCEHTMGKCYFGCDAGYRGDNCEIIIMSVGDSLKSFLNNIIVFILLCLIGLIVVIRSIRGANTIEEHIPEEHSDHPSTSQLLTKDEQVQEEVFQEETPASSAISGTLNVDERTSENGDNNKVSSTSTSSSSMETASDDSNQSIA